MQVLVNNTKMCRHENVASIGVNWVLMKEHVLLLSWLRQVTDSQQVTAYQHRHCCCIMVGECGR